MLKNARTFEIRPHHRHNVPQKITFFMKIYDYENKNAIQCEKLENSQFHIGCYVAKH